MAFIKIRFFFNIYSIIQEYKYKSQKNQSYKKLA